VSLLKILWAVGGDLMCGFFMMPSACKNSDKLSVAEMEPPFKACISAIEKKARNLEKRKVMILLEHVV